MGKSILAGLVAAGIVGVILDVFEVPFGSAAGAFLGALLATWLLYAQRGRALLTGFLVGLFSFPVQLLFFVALVYSGLYTPPEVPEIPESVLLIAFALTVVMQVVGGTVGGLVGWILHRPPTAVVEAPRPYLPPPPPKPEKYCVQCGAGLAKETLVCPACGAKQTS